MDVLRKPKSDSRYRQTCLKKEKSLTPPSPASKVQNDSGGDAET